MIYADPWYHPYMDIGLLAGIVKYGFMSGMIATGVVALAFGIRRGHIPLKIAGVIALGLGTYVAITEYTGTGTFF